MYKKVILASESPYKKNLLKRLRLTFDSLSPHVDESPLPAETGQGLASRLAKKKAEHIAQTQDNALIISSDQVPVVNDQILHKPGSKSAAKEQLLKIRGKAVFFYTAIYLWDKHNSKSTVDTTEVVFRSFSNQEINLYLDHEPAWDCAGAFKSEGLGISLCETIKTSDPTGLIGLPLIALVNFLREHGIQIPPPQEKRSGSNPKSPRQSSGKR